MARQAATDWQSAGAGWRVGERGRRSGVVLELCLCEGLKTGFLTFMAKLSKELAEFLLSKTSFW